MKRRVWLAAGTALALGVACHAGDDDYVAPIPVQPGAAARAMQLVARYKPSPEASDAGDDADEDAAPPLGGLAFACVDVQGPGAHAGAKLGDGGAWFARAPCTASLEGVEPTPTPDFAVDPIALPSGALRATVVPGAYRVTVTRGPEYGAGTWDARVEPDAVARAPVEGAIVVPRVVDTPGVVAVALAPHFADEASARAWIADRATSGLEAVVAPSVDATSLAPLARAMHVGQRFAVVAADDVMAGTFPIDTLSDVDAFAARLAAKTPLTAVLAAGHDDDDARTYVGVADDGAIGTNDAARADDLVRGLRDRRDVVVSTGPFVRVTANGAPVGALVRPKGRGPIELRVHVESTGDVALDRVRVVRTSGVAVDPKPLTFGPTPAGAQAADAVFTLVVSSDEALVVVVDVSSGAADAPWAVSGAIWVDANGDGESLGRTPPPPPPEPPDPKTKSTSTKKNKKEKR